MACCGRWSCCGRRSWCAAMCVVAGILTILLWFFIVFCCGFYFEPGPTHALVTLSTLWVHMLLFFSSWTGWYVPTHALVTLSTLWVHTFFFGWYVPTHALVTLSTLWVHTSLLLYFYLTVLTLADSDRRATRLSDFLFVIDQPWKSLNSWAPTSARLTGARSEDPTGAP